MTENHCQVGLGHDHGSKNQDFHRHAPSVFRLAWVVGPAETEMAGTDRLDCTQQRRRHVYYMWPLRQYIMSLNHKTGVPLDLAIR
jgi:hypothetical protein